MSMISSDPSTSSLHENTKSQQFPLRDISHEAAVYFTDPMYWLKVNYNLEKRIIHVNFFIVNKFIKYIYI